MKARKWSWILSSANADLIDNIEGKKISGHAGVFYWKVVVTEKYVPVKGVLHK